MQHHRNSQKRIYIPDAVYFCTSVTQYRFPYFKEKIFCDLFVKSLKIFKSLKQFKLYAWVLCPDHFHLLIKPNDEFNYSEIMHSLKRNISRNINRILFSTGEDAYPRLNPNIYNGEDMHPRLCSGDGRLDPRLCLDDCDIPYFKWQRGFHYRIIKNEIDFGCYYEYIQFNPEKHNLPDDWEYIFTNPKYENLIDNYYLT